LPGGQPTISGTAAPAGVSGRGGVVEACLPPGTVGYVGVVAAYGKVACFLLAPGKRVVRRRGDQAVRGKALGQEEGKGNFIFLL